MSNKLQKRRSPLRDISPQHNLPSRLPLGTPYEDIPPSPPGKLPSYGSTLSRRSTLASDPSLLPLNDKVTVFDTSHYSAKAAIIPPATLETRRPDDTTNKRATSMPPILRRNPTEQDVVLHPWLVSTKWSQTSRTEAGDSLTHSQFYPIRPEACRKCCKPMVEAPDCPPRQRLSADRDHQACGPNCVEYKRATAPTADDLSREHLPTSMARRAPLSPTDMRSTIQSNTHKDTTAPERAFDPQRAPEIIPSRGLRTCLKCGKYKRPRSMPNQAHQRTVSTPQASVPSTSDWPLPSAGLQASEQASPSGSPPLFEEQSLEHPRYLETTGFSPLIRKTPSSFESARKLSPHPSYARVNAVPSRDGSLIRRISNAVRPAQIPRRSDFYHPYQPADTPHYLTLPSSEHPDRPGSPFSFVVSDFEMAPVAQSAEAEKFDGDDRDHRRTPTVQLTPEASSDISCTSDLYSQPISANPRQAPRRTSLSDTEAVNSGDEEMLSRTSSVLQRAVSGSIRRFKSLRGVHHGWYRDDLTIEGYYGSGDGSRSHQGAERRALDVY